MRTKSCHPLCATLLLPFLLLYERRCSSPSSAMTIKKASEQEVEIPVFNIEQVVVAEPQTVDVDGNNNDATPMVTGVPIPMQEEPPAAGTQAELPETVDVIAPTNMTAGYQFHVDTADGRRFRVQVPAGGVVAGQRFRAIILQNGDNAMALSGQDPHMIPRGRWRDDLCDCCRFGCCHPQCCLTCWCFPCALGQVMTRLKLNCCGEFINGAMPSMSTFRILFALTAVYLVFSWGTNAVISANDEDGDEYSTTGSEDKNIVIVSAIQDIVMLTFGIFLLVITIRTRVFIRRKYQIPTKCCGGCEDCCLSFWCSPCTVCQMARHTANFDYYSATWCSDNGLNAGAPEIV